MRILHFLWGLGKGGAENLAVDLANQQAKDHEVILLVGNDRVDPSVRNQIEPSVSFINLKRPEGSRNPYWIARLLFAIFSLRPDIVHSHTRDLAKLAKFIHQPIILTVHDMNNDLFKSALHFDRICCISKAVLIDVCRRYPALQPQRIDNGIVVSKITMAQNRATPAVLRAVQVSRLVHEIKGQDLLIRALADINAKYNSPALFIDFIGEGPSHEYLSQLADMLNVSEQCNFLGALSREEIYTRLCSYDMLIQPSRYEGFGLTVAEGMAAGIPVVVSDIEGPMEVIDNGNYGYHFRSGDSSALVATLQTLISDLADGTVGPRLVACRQHVLDKYDLATTSENYVRLYQELLPPGHLLTE